MKTIVWILYIASAVCWIIAETPDVFGWLCWILLAVGFKILWISYKEE